MMKKFKKLISCMIAAVMILAMGVTAFASQTGAGAGATPQTYTITAPDNDHTYEVYQIFTGDYSENDEGNPVLSNIKWGKNGTGTQGEAVSDEVIAELAGAGSTDTEKLAVIKKYATLNKENVFGTVSKGKDLDDVPAGYYLIKDVDGALDNTEESYTLYIVEVVGNVTITPKADTTTSQKKVKDTNDTTGETTEWQDSADYDIGDTVPYQLKATLPNNISDYTSYTLKFVDTMSKGLTYDAGSAEVFVNGKSAGKVDPTSENYSGDNPKYTGGKVLTWTFDDIKKVPYNAEDNAVITIEYTATLNENAVIGAAGNPNMSHIEFSNNPNGSGTGKTPDDTNIVFTYKTVVDKVDGEEQSLAGAEFTLEKFVANEDGSDTYNEVKGTWSDAATATIAEEGTQFTFTGLDDGTYRLTETKTPDGYNTIDPIIFTVTATHDVTADDPKLTDLSGTVAIGEITFTAAVDAGSLSTTVINESGTILPETGGIGTRIFYAVGAILMIGAVVLLISRKRSAR